MSSKQKLTFKRNCSSYHTSTLLQIPVTQNPKSTSKEPCITLQKEIEGLDKNRMQILIAMSQSSLSSTSKGFPYIYVPVGEY